MQNSTTEGAISVTIDKENAHLTDANNENILMLESSASSSTAAVVIQKAVYRQKDTATNKNISNIQKALMKAGCWINPDGTKSNQKPSGYYGVVTKASVIKFQMSKMGLTPNQIFYSGKVPTSNYYADPQGGHVGVGPQTATELTTWAYQGIAIPATASMAERIYIGNEIYASGGILVNGQGEQLFVMTGTGPQPVPDSELNTINRSWLLTWAQCQQIQTVTEATPIDTLDVVQNILDIAGLFFDPADGLNVAIYYVRGDKLNAGLSATSLIPIGGVISTGGKFVGKMVKAGSKLDEVVQLAKRYVLSDSYYDTHILYYHGPSSIALNKSKFYSGYDIKKGIDDSLKGSENVLIKPNTADRAGYIFYKRYVNPIGVDSDGVTKCYYLKVVIGENGSVITAYPDKMIR